MTKFFSFCKALYLNQKINQNCIDIELLHFTDCQQYLSLCNCNNEIVLSNYLSLISITISSAKSIINQSTILQFIENPSKKFLILNNNSNTDSYITLLKLIIILKGKKMSTVMNDIEVELVHTGVIGAEDQDALSVTRRALDKIDAIKSENNVPADYSLRLGTQSGGCSGMNYILGFDSEVNENDKLIELHNLNLVIDNKSLFYLMGITLDYVDDVHGSGFVFNNPNNAKTCGCGGGGH